MIIKYNNILYLLVTVLT